jgi:hypothetical protein
MQKQRKISNSTQDEPGLINGELLEDYIWSFEHLCSLSTTIVGGLSKTSQYCDQAGDRKQIR